MPRSVSSTVANWIALASLLIATSTLAAQTETVLHAFTGGRLSADAALPYAGLALHDGKLYGTTEDGGTYGEGAVYEITKAGAESVFYSFTGGPDGGEPVADVVFDKSGNLYGTTFSGGTSAWGTVFRVAADSNESVVYNFAGKPDGGQPEAAVILDNEGNLYGTTYAQGSHKYGTVFKVDSAGIETTLYSFTGRADGAYPLSRLVLFNGELYGTTSAGGKHGYGTVFKMTLAGVETVLHSFAAGTDGANPTAGLSLYRGNFYGTTLGGGGSGCTDFGPPYGCGTVFEISPSGREQVLYSFLAGSDGSTPRSSVIFDGSGNLYGTTSYGGGSNTCDFGCGTVFRLAASGSESVLHSFANNGVDGYYPFADLVMDGEGNFYGTTLSGGGSTDCQNGCGTVFKVSN